MFSVIRQESLFEGIRQLNRWCARINADRSGNRQTDQLRTCLAAQLYRQRSLSPGCKRHIGTHYLHPIATCLMAICMQPSPRTTVGRETLLSGLNWRAMTQTYISKLYALKKHEITSATFMRSMSSTGGCTVWQNNKTIKRRTSSVKVLRF